MQEVSQKTLLNYHTGLSALWTWALKQAPPLVTRHILQELQRPKPEKKAIIPFTEAEVRAMMAVLDKSQPYTRPGKQECRNTLPNGVRNRMVILLLLDTGIRADELCQLKIRDVDMTNKRITVMGKGKKERAAHRQAAKGKRSQGPAADFEIRLADNLLQLQAELTDRTYWPGAYHSFTIHEPKRRLISAAPFRDRVVHHALCNVIEPLFERTFIADSYANRVGKGTHRALDRAQEFAQRFRYVLRCDVRQFFPSIDHAILRRILARKLRDDDTLWLVDRILHSGAGVLDGEYTMHWFPDDIPEAEYRLRGLPIGNLTSQFWANCLLNPFDHFVKRELGCVGYERYVDDTLFFANDKRPLWEWRDASVARLETLRLTIHPGAQPQPTTEGFPFLGFVVYPTHRRVKSRKVLAFRRRLHAQLAAYVAGDVAREAVVQSLLSWINHVRYGDTWGLRRAVLRDVVL